MSVEGRGWVTRVGIDLVNWQQEEPAGLGRRRQLSGGGTSRMSREAQVRICERLGVQLPGAYSATERSRSYFRKLHLRTLLVFRHVLIALHVCRPGAIARLSACSSTQPLQNVILALNCSLRG